jgi:hypothetical protein
MVFLFVEETWRGDVWSEEALKTGFSLVKFNLLNLAQSLPSCKARNKNTWALLTEGK